MKKYLAVALSVMIASAGVPTFADETKTVKEVQIYEETSIEFLKDMIAEGVEVYLELDRKNDPAAEALAEKLNKGFVLVLQNEDSEPVLKGAAEDISEILETHEDESQQESIEKEEKLLEAYVELGNKLKNKDLSETEKEEILKKMEVLEEEWETLQNAFDEDEFDEDEFDEDEFDEDEFDEDEFDEDEFDEDEIDEDEFDEDEFDEDEYEHLDQLIEEIESIKKELSENYDIDLDFEAYEDFENDDSWEDEDDDFEDDDSWEDEDDDFEDDDSWEDDDFEDDDSWEDEGEDFEDDDSWEDEDDDFEDDDSWEDEDDDFEDDDSWEDEDDDFEDDEDWEDYDDDDMDDEEYND